MQIGPRRVRIAEVGLITLPAVATKLDEAQDQARRYGSALRARYGLTDLRLYAVVGVGLERVVWQEVGETQR